MAQAIVGPQPTSQQITIASALDRRWTIMAALLGSSSAVMLFHGMQQELYPRFGRELALTIIAFTLPFQAVWFMIYTYQIAFGPHLGAQQQQTLHRLSSICQLLAYVSVLGLAVLWTSASHYVGGSFLVGAVFALGMVRLAMSEARKHDMLGEGTNSEG
jgi:hypothetical protein